MIGTHQEERAEGAYGRRVQIWRHANNDRVCIQRMCVSYRLSKRVPTSMAHLDEPSRFLDPTIYVAHRMAVAYGRGNAYESLLSGSRGAGASRESRADPLANADSYPERMEDLELGGRPWIRASWLVVNGVANPNPTEPYGDRWFWRRRSAVSITDRRENTGREGHVILDRLRKIIQRDGIIFPAPEWVWCSPPPRSSVLFKPHLNTPTCSARVEDKKGMLYKESWENTVRSLQQSQLVPLENFSTTSTEELDKCNTMIDALAADRVRIADLESKILGLERSLATLREEKNLAQKRLNSYTYPVLNLPHEIVAKIFIHFLPPYPLRPSPPVLAMSDEWLNKTGCCPLSIEIDGIFSPSPELLAINYRARWEYLKLCHARHQPPLGTLEGPMPLLRHLELFGHWGGSLLTGDEAPLLRTVIIRDESDLSGVVLPWVQLTSLTVELVFTHECASILQQASNLTFCALGVISESLVDYKLPDIHLPFLKTLLISNPHREPITGFVDTLVAPRLRTLQISKQFLGEKPIEALASFISKSGCALQLLRITSEYPRVSDLRLYRSAFPSIKKIEFGGLLDPEPPPSRTSISWMNALGFSSESESNLCYTMKFMSPIPPPFLERSMAHAASHFSNTNDLRWNIADSGLTTGRFPYTAISSSLLAISKP
ncbi:hypothetical protein DFH07DRAFT_1031897 [Mycena maculata]|uniref:F-box domain-containing protein n=1 Tax=Mycena maculata TaxID=230809 RepID=A0AAD7NAJ4_9AGAR|nr:hypothetical protein DFH07DRAFT_1031897 [Mycena maculata]